MNLTIYISDDLFAIELKSKENVLYREVCGKDRFIVLMEKLIMPSSYTIVTNKFGLSEYMQIGQLRNMTLLNVVNEDKLNLTTYFNSPDIKKSQNLVRLLSGTLFFIGVLVGLLVVGRSIMQDIVQVRTDRINNVQETIAFIDNRIYNTTNVLPVYLEIMSLYHPFRIELFKVDTDGNLEVMFLHPSSSLRLMQKNTVLNAALSRGASVTIEGSEFYLYQIGGRIE